MKNMKKVLAVMTAVSAFAASTSAFAANVATIEGVTGTYADGKLSVTVPEAATDGEMTLLVLTEGTDVTAVTDENILYIDQQTYGTEGAFQSMGLKSDILAAATTGTGHIIKVGYYDAQGEFQIAEGYVTVADDAESGNTVTLKWGDINGDDSVNNGDALLALYAGLGDYGTVTLNGVNVVVGDIDTDAYSVVGAEEGAQKIKWGDINGDDSVNNGDALLALYAGLGDYGDVTVRGQSTKVGKPGVTATTDLTNKTIIFNPEAAQ